MLLTGHLGYVAEQLPATGAAPRARVATASCGRQHRGRGGPHSSEWCSRGASGQRTPKSHRHRRFAELHLRSEPRLRVSVLWEARLRRVLRPNVCHRGLGWANGPPGRGCCRRWAEVAAWGPVANGWVAGGAAAVGWRRRRHYRHRACPTVEANGHWNCCWVALQRRLRNAMVANEARARVHRGRGRWVRRCRRIMLVVHRRRQRRQGLRRWPLGRVRQGRRAECSSCNCTRGLLSWQLTPARDCHHGQ